MGDVIPFRRHDSEPVRDDTGSSDYHDTTSDFSSCESTEKTGEGRASLTAKEARASKARERLSKALASVVEAGEANRKAMRSFQEEMGKLKESTDALGDGLKAYGDAIKSVDVDGLRQTGRKLRETASAMPVLPETASSEVKPD